MVISSYALSGIIAQVLKYYIVEARPAVFLKDSSYKYFIENVTLHNFHAFPQAILLLLLHWRPYWLLRQKIKIIQCGF